MKKIKCYKSGFELYFKRKGNAGRPLKDLLNKGVSNAWNRSLGPILKICEYEGSDD
jgi:hypothetical protein